MCNLLVHLFVVWTCKRLKFRWSSLASFLFLPFPFNYSNEKCLKPFLFHPSCFSISLPNPLSVLLTVSIWRFIYYISRSSVCFIIISLCLFFIHIFFCPVIFVIMSLNFYRFTHNFSNFCALQFENLSFWHFNYVWCLLFILTCHLVCLVILDCEIIASTLLMGVLCIYWELSKYSSKMMYLGRAIWESKCPLLHL